MNAVKKWRLQTGYTQVELAKLMDCSQPLISGVETGEILMTPKFSRAFNKVTIDAILTPEATRLKAKGVKEIVVKAPERAEHYHQGGIDVWTFADKNFSKEETIGFYRINAIKYVTRFGKKLSYNQEDLDKAMDYIKKLKEITEGM